MGIYGRRTVLVNCENNSRFELEKNIAPGESAEIMVSWEKGSHPHFRLENEYGVICMESEFDPENMKE